MCRLFGMSAGHQRVRATFWLLDATDSLEAQSRRNPDGTGLGFFDEAGIPTIDKQPEAAYSDVEFISESKAAESTTFVAHVRIATTGLVSVENTHPFTMDGRIMAHNGGFDDLAAVEAELGDAMSMVHGDTDSERYAALVAREITRNGGDVGAGITAAATWLSENVPLFSLNLVLATPTDLWALRYPDQFGLHVLHRSAGGRSGDDALEVGTDLTAVASDHLADHPAVMVASEPMDDHPDWRLMDSGELVHVGPDLAVTTAIVLPGEPTNRTPVP